MSLYIILQGNNLVDYETKMITFEAVYQKDNFSNLNKVCRLILTYISGKCSLKSCIKTTTNAA